MRAVAILLTGGGCNPADFRKRASADQFVGGTSGGGGDRRDPPTHHYEAAELWDKSGGATSFQWTHTREVPRFGAEACEALRVVRCQCHNRLKWADRRWNLASSLSCGRHQMPMPVRGGQYQHLAVGVEGPIPHQC